MISYAFVIQNGSSGSFNTQARKGCYKTVTIPDVRRTTSSDSTTRQLIKTKKKKKRNLRAIVRLSVKSGTGCTPQGPELKLHIKSKNREKQQRLRISTRIACNNAHININIKHFAALPAASFYTGLIDTKHGEQSLPAYQLHEADGEPKPAASFKTKLSISIKTARYLGLFPRGFAHFKLSPQ